MIPIPISFFFPTHLLSLDSVPPEESLARFAGYDIEVVSEGLVPADATDLVLQRPFLAQGSWARACVLLAWWGRRGAVPWGNGKPFWSKIGLLINLYFTLKRSVPLLNTFMLQVFNTL